MPRRLPVDLMRKNLMSERVRQERNWELQKFKEDGMVMRNGIFAQFLMTALAVRGYVGGNAINQAAEDIGISSSRLNMIRKMRGHRLDEEDRAQIARFFTVNPAHMDSPDGIWIVNFTEGRMTFEPRQRRIELDA